MICSKDCLLLLTATVNPGVVPVQRANPQIRETEYLTALNFWLKKWGGIQRIVFIENSGWPLDKFRALADKHREKKDVEFISLNINHLTGARGKGYGESRLIEEGLPLSKHFQEVSYIVKVTGRLKLLNLNQILRKLPAETDLAAENSDNGLFRELCHYVNQEEADLFHRWLDTRFFLVKKTFWQTRLAAFSDLLDDRDGRYLEHRLFQLAHHEQLGRTAVIVHRLPRIPNWRGVGAGTGENYGSWKNRYRVWVQACIRRYERFKKLKFPMQ